jgi:hypothetical protein
MYEPLIPMAASSLSKQQFFSDEIKMKLETP